MMFALSSPTTMKLASQGSCSMAPTMLSMEEASSGARYHPITNQCQDPVAIWNLKTVRPCCWWVSTPKYGDSQKNIVVPPLYHMGTSDATIRYHINSREYIPLLIFVSCITPR